MTERGEGARSDHHQPTERRGRGPRGCGTAGSLQLSLGHRELGQAAVSPLGRGGGRTCAQVVAEPVQFFDLNHTACKSKTRQNVQTLVTVGEEDKPSHSTPKSLHPASTERQASGLAPDTGNTKVYEMCPCPRGPAAQERLAGGHTPTRQGSGHCDEDKPSTGGERSSGVRRGCQGRLQRR